MMKSLVISALCLMVSSGTFASDLASKHPSLSSKTMPEMSQCLTCHGSYATLAEKTKNLTPNPHASHMANVQCDACHQWQGKSVLMCNECHHFPHLEKALQ